VPFGANLDQEPDEAMVMRDITQRSTDRLELLFLGVAWKRKGGPKALEVARILHERGVPVRLRIIGCVPPEKDLPPYVEVTPFISKTSAAGAQALNDAIRTSHFLLLPTLAECFGIVFAEASAHGVPSITHDVGGVSTAITEGVNGHLFTVDSPAEDMAERIEATFAMPGHYTELAVSSFAQYKARLNWRVNGAELASHLRSIRRRSLEPVDGLELELRPAVSRSH
jgi:glycosyltransferase involved in cell wall biosynthesis